MHTFHASRSGQELPRKGIAEQLLDRILAPSQASLSTTHTQILAFGQHNDTYKYVDLQVAEPETEMRGYRGPAASSRQESPRPPKGEGPVTGGLRRVHRDTPHLRRSGGTRGTQPHPGHRGTLRREDRSDPARPAHRAIAPRRDTQTPTHLTDTTKTRDNRTYEVIPVLCRGRELSDGFSEANCPGNRPKIPRHGLLLALPAALRRQHDTKLCSTSSINSSLVAAHKMRGTPLREACCVTGDLLLTGRPATVISPDSTLNTIQILVSALNTGGRPVTRPPAPRHQVMPPQPARQRA